MQIYHLLTMREMGDPMSGVLGDPHAGGLNCKPIPHEGSYLALHILALR